MGVDNRLEAVAVDWRRRWRAGEAEKKPGSIGNERRRRAGEADNRLETVTVTAVWRRRWRAGGGDKGSERSDCGLEEKAAGWGRRCCRLEVKVSG